MTLCRRACFEMECWVSFVLLGLAWCVVGLGWRFSTACRHIELSFLWCDSFGLTLDRHCHSLTHIGVSLQQQTNKKQQSIKYTSIGLFYFEKFAVFPITFGLLFGSPPPSPLVSKNTHTELYILCD